MMIQAQLANQFVISKFQVAWQSTDADNCMFLCMRTS